MTLIYASNSDGCTGRCDATCHNATGSECHCICGGMNHGVGLAKARENTQAYAETWIEKWKEIHPDDRVQLGAGVLKPFTFAIFP